MSIVVNKTRLPVTEWQTASGSVVSISDARKRNAKSLSVALEPIQDLHGYANPWVGGAGANAMPNAVAKTETQNGITISTNGDGIYRFSGTALSDAIVVFPLSVRFTIPSGKADTGTHSVFFMNTDINSTNVALCFMNGSVQVEIWNMSPKNRVVTAYNAMSNKVCDGIKFIIRSGMSVSGTISPMFVAKGTPTDTPFSPYENLCPISGHSAVHAYDDPKYGGKIWWNQLVLDGNFPTTDNWRLGGVGDFAVNNNKAILTVTNGQTYDTFLKQSCSYTKGHKILIDMYFKVTTESTATYISFCVGYKGVGAGTQVFRYYNTRNQNVRCNGIFTLGYDADLLYVGKIGAYGALNTGDTIEIWNMQIFDLTQMFGAGNEPTLEQFRALFPKDYYDYNAGTETLVSAVNGDPYISVTVQLGQTVYGGTVDLVSGVGTLTMANIASYNGETIGEPWLSSMDKYVAGATPTTGAQVVYTLATPITFQLTPTQIEMLERYNTIWSDDGIVTVNYARIHS